MTVSKKNGLEIFVRIISVLLLCALVAFTCAAAARIGRDSRADGVRRAEQAVRTAVMSCYAAEGVYPPSVEYLEQHYGLSVDGRIYTVHYIASGRNIMPDITVTVNE